MNQKNICSKSSPVLTKDYQQGFLFQDMQSLFCRNVKSNKNNSSDFTKEYFLHRIVLCFDITNRLLSCKTVFKEQPF